jgi:hypothetical protein
MDKTNEAEQKKASGRRMFRRFRARFRAELGIENPSEADKTLLNQAALLALREQQLREQILTGAIGKKTDEDIVRLVNALRRIREELRKSAAAKSKASEMSWSDKQAEAERIMREEDEAAARADQSTEDDAA